MYACFYSGKMRAQYNIKGDGCTDCLKHFCCNLCALTQQYRELKHRGFDMSLGNLFLHDTSYLFFIFLIDLLV